MQKTTYICDKCGAKSEKDNLIGIHAEFDGCSYFGRTWINNSSIEICTSCAEKVGLIKRVIKDNEIVNTPMEDIGIKVYDIIEEVLKLREEQLNDSQR
jgi:DNA-directed RNA polymerase subunit RPC12/RpoP